MLRDDINNALKNAMKAGEARRVSTLRLRAKGEPGNRLIALDVGHWRQFTVDCASRHGDF